MLYTVRVKIKNQDGFCTTIMYKYVKAMYNDLYTLFSGHTE